MFQPLSRLPSVMNAEAIEAWNTVLFDKFVQYRELLVTNLAVHGSRAIDRLAPKAGQRIVDLGCGFGDTAIDLARRVGRSGRVVGIDAAPRFISTARYEARDVANVSFDVADVQEHVPGGPYDLAYSRMGMMFFASPVRALRNVRKVLVPGGRLCMVVWRNKTANAIVTVPEDAVSTVIGEPDKGDHVTCGPGPFSMASCDVLSEQLDLAGFTNITFERSDADLLLGNDLDEAVEYSLTLGPAGERMRLAGRLGIARRAEIVSAVRASLAPYVTASGVRAGSSCWIVSATAS